MAENVFIPYWMRGTQLESKYKDLWAENPYASKDLILSMLREEPAWDTLFPGNRYPDGSPIHTEDNYRRIESAFSDALISIDVNPSLFRAKFPELIQGHVSPDEFVTRVETVYSRVIDAAPAIRNFYASNFSEDMTDSAIVASFLDPDVGQAILSKQVAMSEVGGEAAESGFSVTTDFAKNLVNAGLDSQSEAAQFFGLAENMLPVLGTLSARHADPDDPFDLEEFTEYQLFNDPAARQRVRRLLAQEETSFGPDSMLAVNRNQSGSLTGLTER